MYLEKWLEGDTVMDDRQSCIDCEKHYICEKATHIENYRLRGCKEFVKRADKHNEFSSTEILNNYRDRFYNDDNIEQ